MLMSHMRRPGGAANYAHSLDSSKANEETLYKLFKNIVLPSRGDMHLCGSDVF